MCRMDLDYGADGFRPCAHRASARAQVMRKHVDAIDKNEPLAQAGVSALRMFVAGDESGMICGSAAEVAHTMTTAMTRLCIRNDGA